MQVSLSATGIETTPLSCGRAGVVKLYCEVFGVRRLYVAGSLLFPTSGCAQPALAIVAMQLASQWEPERRS